uniref:Fibrinogen C-terminal domain-containing protein n=1 Tax=Anopheles christyi TaxID=43041 RepID=A0A182JWK8_9DIPT
MAQLLYFPDLDTKSTQLDFLQNKLVELDSTVQQLNEKIGHNLTALQTQSSRMLTQQTTCATNEQLQKELQALTPRKEKSLPIVQTSYQSSTPNRFGGGWLVIQQRYDGLLSFQRSWNAYRDGFGSVLREFWIGLQRVHRMTSARTHELVVELEDFSGNYVYARYREFEVGCGKDLYPLKKVGGYTGTASDGLKFTMMDLNNDADGNDN